MITGLLLSASIRAKEGTRWPDYWEKPVDFDVAEADSRDRLFLFQSAGLVWIRIYQKGISSQDLPACVFHPSCSRFAFACIKEYGILKGTLLAADRLLRCNPFAYKYYRFDGEKFKDPVGDYHFR